MKLAADANVLLSALVLTHPEVEQIFTADAVLAEVQEYAGHLAAKKRIHLDSSSWCHGDTACHGG